MLGYTLWIQSVAMTADGSKFAAVTTIQPFVFIYE
jgi:hypothetical protein